MERLPPELIIEIFDRLASIDRKQVRLTCRSFNSIVQDSMFALLATFIDSSVAVDTVVTKANHIRPRVTSIWSPHCSVPRELPVPSNFLSVMYLGLTGRRWEESSAQEEAIMVNEEITVKGMARRVGRAEIHEENLRQALFRWVLYLSYVNQDRSTPCDWVLAPQTAKSMIQGQQIPFEMGKAQAVR